MTLVEMYNGIAPLENSLVISFKKLTYHDYMIQQLHSWALYQRNKDICNREQT